MNPCYSETMLLMQCIISEGGESLDIKWFGMKTANKLFNSD